MQCIHYSRGHSPNCINLRDMSLKEVHIIAERLSARQLIVQCGLKSQLACIYIYICAQLPSRLGMQLNLRLRSLYVLLLCLYVPYTCCYYSCNETLPAPGSPRGEARVQDGVLTSYMDAAFVLLTPEGLEIWTNRSLLFTQVGLLQLRRD